MVTDNNNGDGNKENNINNKKPTSSAKTSSLTMIGERIQREPVLTDGKTTIRPITKEQQQKEKRNFHLKNPILIVGIRS